jgi:hypothetical protein
MKWILIKKLSQMSGMTEDAIRALKKKGIWHEGSHWKKAPNGRIFFNPKAIEQWVEGKAV